MHRYAPIFRYLAQGTKDLNSRFENKRSPAHSAGLEGSRISGVERYFVRHDLSYFASAGLMAQAPQPYPPQ